MLSSLTASFSGESNWVQSALREPGATTSRSPSDWRSAELLSTSLSSLSSLSHLATSPTTSISYVKQPASSLQYWQNTDITSAAKRDTFELFVESAIANLLPFAQGIDSVRLMTVKKTLATMSASIERFSIRRFYDELTKMLTADWSGELQWALSGLLRAAEPPVQETVLGCLADLDAVLTGPLLREIAALLHSGSLVTARNAAMALSAGGSEAVDLLHLELEKTPQGTRDMIEKLLHFASR